MGQNSRFLQPEQRCVSHPFLLSVLLCWKCWSTLFPSLQLPVLWDSFCAAQESWAKKKSVILGSWSSEQVCWSSSTLALKRKTEHMWLLRMQHYCFLECETVCHREYRPCLAYGTEFGEKYLDPLYFYLPVVHDKTCKQSVTRRYLLRLCAIRSVTQCSFCTADRLHQSWTMASVWRDLVQQLHWLLLWAVHHVLVASENWGFKAPTKELCLFFQAHQVLFFAFVKWQLQFCFVFMFVVKCFEQGCFLWKHFFERVRV